MDVDNNRLQGAENETIALGISVPRFMVTTARKGCIPSFLAGHTECNNLWLASNSP